MDTSLADAPPISVVMTVYNGERFLEAAIRSILGQTYEHWELIIADDGSTDASPAIIHAFAAQDTRIRPFYLTHGGSGWAANAAVTQARGALLARMDQDDVALPQRLARQHAWMMKTGVDLCGSCVQGFEDAQGFNWFPETHAAIRHDLLLRPAMLQGTLLLRTTILRDHPYDETARFDDYELLTRLAPLYRLGNVQQVLLKWRCHSAQSHVVQKLALRTEARRWRTRYFATLFSDGCAADAAVVLRLADQEAFASLSDLARAGAWLVRLARTPDNFLRECMAERWRAACLRSAQLGWQAYRLYHRLADEFGVPLDGGDTYRFRLAFALRQPPGSRLRKLAQRGTALVRRQHAIRGGSRP